MTENQPVAIRTPPETPPGSAEAKKVPPLLTHIQALRAIAVLLVVLYHLWPRRLTGGYVGVDVFFVISGYLMTAHILRGTASGRSIGAGLNDFYIRRIRRILPASLFVLFVITIVTLVAVSRIEWEQYFRGIVAATLYVENWSLAASSTDYLAAGVGASPVQHFWSLSVEEQFYLVWPVLLLVVSACFAARVRQRAVIGLVTLLIAGSLTYSVFSTHADPKFAYFDTLARLWEFGIGGILAVVPWMLVKNKTAAAILAYLGLAAIAASALLYSGATEFPGYAALLPVVGTALVIASGQTSAAWGPQRVMAIGPIQFIGDISYSMYLWHWPMIVLVPVVAGISLSTPVRLGIFVVTVALSWVSKTFLEDPFRRGFLPRRGVGSASTSGAPRQANRRGWPVYLAALGAMTVIVSLAGAGWLSISGQMAQARDLLSATEASTPACFGAEVLDGSSGCGTGGPTLTQVVPDPLVASEDFPYDVCQQRASRSDIINCSFGSDDPSAKSVALIGDSHATQWLPALIGVADQRNWHITTYLMSGCAFAASDSQDKCGQWNSAVRQELAGHHYDAAVVSARGASSLAEESGSSSASLARAWQEVIDQGTTVIAIRDVPQPENAGIHNVPACVFDNSASACSFSEEKAERYDLIPAAAALVPEAKMVDMSRYFCTSGTCDAVIGSVLVYLDGNHMTATYARSLVDPLLGELAPIAVG